jgi:hypothetical protein
MVSLLLGWKTGLHIAYRKMNAVTTATYKSFQYTFVIIGYAFYSKADKQGRFRRWPIRDRITRGASAFGDWVMRISKSTTPASKRSTRIYGAYHSCRTRSTSIIAMSVLAMQAHATIAKEKEVRFDTDSSNVGVDNRCTACISHDIGDFEPGSIRPSNRVVKGFGGSRATNVKTGTLRWKWEDDQGVVTEFQIPNSYLVPDGKVRLLSPQHWAQTQATTRKDRGRCSERTDGNTCTLSWEAGRHKRTIPLNRENNVATFSLAPGFSNFESFCVRADLVDPFMDPIALPSGIISDDDGDTSVASKDTDDETDVAPVPPSPSTDKSDLKAKATPVEFNLNGGPTTSASEGRKRASTSTINVITDKEDRHPSDLAELLMLHHQFGHISMRKMQEMAKQGMIPRRLATCRIPTCSACLYSKANKRPWRGKESKQGDGKEMPKRPGQSGISRPARISYSGVDRPDDGFSNNEEVHIYNCLRGPIHPIRICPPAEDSNRRGNGRREEGIRGHRKTQRNPH